MKLCFSDGQAVITYWYFGDIRFQFNCKLSNELNVDSNKVKSLNYVFQCVSYAWLEVGSWISFDPDPHPTQLTEIFIL